MNKKVMLYILCFVCFLMPIFSIEGIIPWIIAIFFINISIKGFEKSSSLKKVITNTLLCAVVIVSYNIIARIIEKILVNLWV